MPSTVGKVTNKYRKTGRTGRKIEHNMRLNSVKALQAGQMLGKELVTLHPKMWERYVCYSYRSPAGSLLYGEEVKDIRKGIKTSLGLANEKDYDYRSSCCAVGILWRKSRQAGFQR
jgi:hypothetical protein